MSRRGFGMTRIVLVIGALLVAVSVRLWAEQARPEEPPIRLMLPRNVDMDSCRFQYLVGGSFGGYGSFVDRKRDLHRYEIEMLHEGEAVETVKAFVACSG